ncbi:DUF6786 family protein [Paraglaciecola sp. L3A3]|uniref:DUF6786 family protein n=1 Tax=Paraglaciecola sp. L3A3 TaxID=2686358 RepID=UPI00131BA8D2|nr:DUF6786 family protein [Paraglaciecola sp. L3A3]
MIKTAESSPQKGTFAYDLDYLKRYQQVITLEENNGKSQIIILPELQGRVMTSTASGLAGNSYGWMHYDLLAAGKFAQHINPFGGEDRFWIGPEGGQYSIFFKKGSEFVFDDWFTPAALDTEPFDVISQSSRDVSFEKNMQLINYQGFEFDIKVKRKVTIFDKKSIEKDLGIILNNKVDYVAYQSDNEIVNTGIQTWKKETGLLSIWILGMYIPSDNTTVIIPYKNELSLNTSYFGEVPEGRLTTTDKHVMFKGNGTARFKLGLPPKNVEPYIGSYDADKNMLTIVGYTFDGRPDYVNSEWREHQNGGYQGDVINSYNDGPLDNGEQLGPFYELESSSHAEELQPNASIQHLHKTYHFAGDFTALNKIAKKVLQKDLTELK